jgi:hypothetical protein
MITITFGAWMIPTAITAIGLIWAMFIVDDGGGYFSGISNIFALVPVLFVSCIAWILWGIFK